MKYGTWRLRRLAVLARRRQRRLRMPFRLGEEPLCVERGGTSGAGGGHRLPVDVILHVAGREDARDVRLGRLALRDQVAVLVVVEPVDEQLRRRIVADRDEEAVGRVLDRLVGLDVPQQDARQLAGVDPERLLDDERRQDLDLLVGLEPGRP